MASDGDTATTKKTALEIHKELGDLTHDRLRQQITRLDEFTVKTGEYVVRSAFLLNGGAILAALTFLGNLASKEHGDAGQSYRLGNSVLLLIMGILSAGLAGGFAYCVNYTSTWMLSAYERDYTHPYVHATKKSRRLKRIVIAFQLFSAGSVVLSFLLFAVGGYELAISLRHILASPA